MSTITPTETPLNYFRENATLISWASIGDSDTCTAIEMPGSQFKSFQVTGTFSSATVVCEGSNDGTNFITLHDLNGNAVSFTSAGLKSVEEVVRYIRPKSTGGSTSSTTASLLLVRRGK